MHQHRELNPHIYNPNYPDSHYIVHLIQIEDELGFIIPKELVKQYNITEDTPVTITLESNGGIRIRFV